MMFGTALLMGSSYPFAKDVLAVMSPLLYSASRYLVASLFLFAMMALMRRPLALPRRDWVPMILLSLVGVALFQACWGLAMARSAPVGRLDRHDHDDGLLGHPGLARRAPAAGTGLGRHRHRLRRRRAGGQQLARPASRSPFGSLDGALLWVLAAFAWALYVDRGAPYNLRLGALPVMAWTTLIGSLVLLPISLVFDSLAEFARLDERLLGYWLYTAIFPVGVAFLGISAGLDRLGVSRVMVYMYLIPVAGVGLSAAFFGDPLTSARVLGGLIVLLGVILTRVALDRAPRVPV